MTDTELTRQLLQVLFVAPKVSFATEDGHPMLVLTSTEVAELQRILRSTEILEAQNISFRSTLTEIAETDWAWGQEGVSRVTGPCAKAAKVALDTWPAE